MIQQADYVVDLDPAESTGGHVVTGEPDVSR